MKSHRRNLLKGSLAVPVVLTVRPASALARTSAMACALRDAEKARLMKPPPVSPIPPDEWLTAKLQVVKLELPHGTDFKEVDGRFFLGSDRVTYWRISDEPGAASASPSRFTVLNAKATPAGTQFAILHFDSQGHRTGLAIEKGRGSPLTGSCWHSLRPRAV